MADPYGNYQANQGLLSGPALNPQGIDPEWIRQLTGLLSQPGPAVGLGYPAGLGGATGLANTAQTASDLGKYAVEGGGLSQDQLISKSFDAASALAAGGMPMAESGAAGIFGGRLAANAEKQTGWFRSPIDNLERFEIPDNKAVYTEPLAQMKTPISAVLSHPEFYDAYPGLKDMLTVTRKEMPKDVGGEYDLMGNINLNKNLSPEEAKSVLLHEIQHAVQEKEGFARGSSPEYERQITGANQGDAYGFYHRTAGETEARNVQARHNYGILARQAWPPWVTQDVPWMAQLRR
jgi:hypothetical protein